ncbi:hypothetical protein FRB94_012871 [Tulasnella sp. JGI-2019a]|nr:hypothetical protein FRB94_012871 [Tulasnella sp. JGI-2019a]KAG9022838.1 hypothetical protein FRB95_014075 [Tulasnella sp. JGI-2019a]
MAQIKVGDTIPSGTFKYVPWAPELDEGVVCGIPVQLNTDEWKGKKVVIVAVPGAFTPTCHVNHLPPYLEKYDELRKKADAVYVLSGNDVFVMAGWAKSQGFKDKIIALSDVNSKWSEEMGMSQDLSVMGMGKRPLRYALILDDLKVTSVEIEPGKGVTETGVDAMLGKL